MLKYHDKRIVYPQLIPTDLGRDGFIDQQTYQQDMANVQVGKEIIFLPNYARDSYHMINGTASNFAILLIGTLCSGAKACVTLINPPIFIDIFCYKLVITDVPYAPDTLGVIPKSIIRQSVSNTIFQEFAAEFTSLNNKQFGVCNFEYVCQRIYDIGARDNPNHVGIRCYFSTKKEKDNFARHIYACKDFFVASNFRNALHAAFVTSGKLCGFWSILTNYTCVTDSYKKKSKAEFEFVCDFNNFTSINKGHPLYDQYAFNQGHNMILTWDIETSQVKTEHEDEEEVPEEGIITRNNQIINICATLSSTRRPKEVLLRLGISRAGINDYVQLVNGDGQNILPDCDRSHDFDIMCKNQREMILAFTYILERLQPDFMVSYNGGNFDIPVLLLQSRLEGVFDEMYCRSSMLTIHNTKNREIHPKYKCSVSGDVKTGYSFWYSVNTNEYISGIPDGCPRLSPQKVREFKLENNKNLSYHHWDIPGCIHIDLYLVARKSFPKEFSYKLSNMLKKKKISQAKNDVSYAEIWEIFARSAELASPEQGSRDKIIYDLARIDEYCKQDCFCTYLLLCSFSYLNEKREMSRCTHLPLDIVIYQADNAKVCAGVQASCYKIGYVCLGIKISTAYIHSYGNPNLHKYHKTPEKLYNRGAIVNIFEPGKVHIKLTYEGREYIFPMPCEALDVQSLYPNTMICQDLSAETITQIKPADESRYIKHYLPDLPESLRINDSCDVWIRRHNNDKSQFGIVPKFLIDLFDYRITIKAKLAAVEAQADDMYEHLTENYPLERFLGENPHLGKLPRDRAVEAYREYILRTHPEYADMLSLMDTLNSYQQTIKILMNTTYGCTKYVNSELYCYIISHITTKFGREVITFVNTITKEAGNIPIYNDTDSIYFVHNPERFRDILIRKITGQITLAQFERKLVRRSMKLTLPMDQWISMQVKRILGYQPKAKTLSAYEELLEQKCNDPESDPEKCVYVMGYQQKIHQIAEKYPGKLPDMFQQIVNTRLVTFSGGPYIRMVREETLYPAIFLAKKKYFGVVHPYEYKDLSNIDVSNLLVKGISYVTRNASGILKKFNRSIMLNVIRSGSIDCEKIIFDEMIKLYNTRDCLDDYICRYTYKSDKKNQALGPVNRMRILREEYPELAHLYRIPSELEVIELIDTAPVVKYRINGNVKSPKAADFKEYPTTVKELGLPIDYLKYLKSMYTSCAQFLTYKRFPFYEAPKDSEDDDYDEDKESDRIKLYKDNILKLYVKPWFKKYLASLPENQQEDARNKGTQKLYREYPQLYFTYISQNYPDARDVLWPMYYYIGATPFKYYIKLAERYIMTEEKYPGEALALIPPMSEINILYKLIMKNEPYINRIYYRLEELFYNHLRKCYERGVIPQACDIYPILSEIDVARIIEFGRAISIYAMLTHYYKSVDRPPTL